MNELNKKKKTIEQYISKHTYLSGKTIRELISDGSVSLNDKIVSSRSDVINDYSSDIVKIKNKVIKKIEKKEITLIAFNKPLNCLVTKSNFENRTTVFNIIPEKYQEYYSVGRLDYKTEGLMLFTNNSKFSSFLEKSNFSRKYKARVYGNIEKLKHFIKNNKTTIIQNQVKYNIQNISILNSNKSSRNHSIMVTIKEGKNNEIRNIFKYFELQVSKLMRISYASFFLDDLETSKTKNISNKLNLFKVKDFYKNYSID